MTEFAQIERGVITLRETIRIAMRARDAAGLCGASAACRRMRINLYRGHLAELPARRDDRRALARH